MLRPRLCLGCDSRNYEAPTCEEAKTWNRVIQETYCLDLENNGPKFLSLYLRACVAKHLVGCSNQVLPVPLLPPPNPPPSGAPIAKLILSVNHKDLT